MPLTPTRNGDHFDLDIDQNVIRTPDNAPRWMHSEPSEGRKNFIRTLLAEREVDAELRAELFAQAGANTMTTGQAIGWIEVLKGQPRKGGAAPRRNREVTVTEEGFYLFNNEAFRVQRTKDGERFYAKKATSTGWDYESAKGVVFDLTPEMLMTAADIAKFGVERQFCIECSTKLTDPVSQHVGLGTSCGPKILGKEGYKAAKQHAIDTYPEVAEYVAMQKAGEKARRTAKKAQAAAESAPSIDQDELLAAFGVDL